jgi:hypothetical protein
VVILQRRARRIAVPALLLVVLLLPACRPKADESTVSVLETSDQKERAERFVEFVLSDEAQTYFTQEDFEYPLVEGIPLREGLPPLDTSGSPAVDPDKLGGELKATLTLIERSGLGK